MLNISDDLLGLPGFADLESQRLETLQGRQVTAKRLRALAGRLEGVS
jgi:hypothetical protein